MRFFVKDEKINMEVVLSRSIVRFKDGCVFVALPQEHIISIVDITAPAGVTVPGQVVIAVYYCRPGEAVRAVLAIIDEARSTVINAWDPFRYFDMYDRQSKATRNISACAGMCWTSSAKLRRAIRLGYMSASKYRHYPNNG